MQRFWQSVVGPIIEAIHPKVIVEIGADTGKNTVNILEYCARESAVLHSIDPVPKFDVDLFKQKYPDNFIFHQALSLNVIHQLESFDAVLIDGDHNWYTVYNELKLLEKKCIKTERDFPLVILHDIAWPYARRDLYYNPDNIPGKFLKPYEKKGILPGVENLDENDEGLNAYLCNSIYENDFQNGVLTAIEDFLAETGFQIEFLKLPGLNGLGVLVPANLIEENAGVAEWVKRLKLDTSVAALIDVIEADRINGQLLLSRTKKEYRLRNESTVGKLQEARKSDEIKFRQQIEALTVSLEKNKQALTEKEVELGEKINLLTHFQNLNDQKMEDINSFKTQIQRLNEISNRQHQDIERYRLQIRSLEEDVKAVRNLMEKFLKQVQKLLQSRRWRMGNRIGDISQKVLFRSGGPSPVDHIHGLIQQFGFWKENLKKNPASNEGWVAQQGSESRKSTTIISIIIPIYNAFEDLNQCLQSVMEKTETPFHLILIDDGSSDERIGPLIQQYERKHNNVTAVSNGSNLGYTATINKGCRLAGPADIVLLNSDTIVTSAWITKLQACAESQNNVATVTPLSNAAGAFSVPKNNQTNEIPEFMTIDDMAALIERLSPRLRPSVPTGNGFCMYITRAALDAVGCFDETNFPKGYGEENDFCMRASQKGFVHLIDDSTFIFHKRTASFKETKDEILKESMSRLHGLHPEYKRLVSQWLKNDPLNDFRKHIEKVIRFEHSSFYKKSLKQGKPVVLYVLHNGRGGVFYTSFDLFFQAAKGKFHCFLLQTDLNKWFLYEANNDQPQIIKEYKFKDKWRIDAPFDGQRQKVLKEVASICCPDIVHVRHFLGNHPDIIKYFKRINCHTIFSIHDFYTICPTIQLVDDSGRFCEGVCSPRNGECACARNWFLSMPPLKNHFVFEWRGIVGAALKMCDEFVVTSGTTQNLMLKHFPFLAEEAFHLIEHGRDFDGYEFTAAFPDAGQPMKVIFFGALGMNKGGQIVRGILEHNIKMGNLIQLHILGNTNLSFNPGRFGCVCHGEYKRDELPQKLSEINPAVAIIPSVWPETFCHTLTEAWRAGIPVLGSELGAVGDRIKRNGGGWTLPPKDPILWAEKLIEISRNKSDYDEKIKDIQQMRFKTLSEMTQDYLELYEVVLKRN